MDMAGKNLETAFCESAAFLQTTTGVASINVRMLSDWGRLNVRKFSALSDLRQRRLGGPAIHFCALPH
jgi:hypothetical protein